MAGFVTALKSYGQHFLHDKKVLEDIVKVVRKHYDAESLVEIGPGMGALTEYLLKEFNSLTCIEVDKRCIDYLNVKYKEEIQAVPPKLKLIDADFMKISMKDLGEGPVAVVGNFPYNISSQIVFKVLENYLQVPFMVGMFQKEMGHRIASPPGSKEYGVISVLAQLLYDVNVEFDISPGSFSPPPKVMSSVITMKRKENIDLDFNFSLFRTVVKSAFNQRRKMLRNGLSGVASKELLQQDIFMRRPEQLSVQEFIDITRMIEKK